MAQLRTRNPVHYTGAKNMLLQAGVINKTRDTTERSTQISASRLEMLYKKSKLFADLAGRKTMTSVHAQRAARNLWGVNLIIPMRKRKDRPHVSTTRFPSAGKRSVIKASVSEKKYPKLSLVEEYDEPEDGDSDM